MLGDVYGFHKRDREEYVYVPSVQRVELSDPLRHGVLVCFLLL